MSLTAEYLRSRLDYDPDTGTFTWKAKVVETRKDNCWNAKYPGTVAGTTNNYGYNIITIDKKKYMACRLAWLHVYGHNPKEKIDHRDRNRLNDRLSNLRAASEFQNSWNTTTSTKNTSGFKGVNWVKRSQKWQARICVYKKQTFLGLFDDISDAADAYAAAANKYFGEYAATSENRSFHA